MKRIRISTFIIVLFIFSLCNTSQQKHKDETENPSTNKVEFVEPPVLHVDSIPKTEIKLLEIGEYAPDFLLPGVDEKFYSLKDFKEYKILMVVFTCNHCPTAQAYEDRLIAMVQEYKPKGVGFVAIQPNHPDAGALEESGYSDLEDTFEDMKIRAKDKQFNFPYLNDGYTEQVSMAYGPVATPHVFIFDEERKLRYRGRFDDMENPYEQATSTDTKNALDALLTGEEVPVATTKTFGCSVKWAWKSGWKQKLDKDWSEKEINLEMADKEKIKEICANKEDKLRMLNIWATWCGPCVVEYPELVKIHRIYHGRGFEFISLSLDKPENEEKVLGFLKEKQSAVNNYIYSGKDKYAVIEAVDKEWQGELPYTALIAPGGELVYKISGEIDPLEIRKKIVGYFGKYFADDK